jgi:hypothetical protein
MALITRRQFIRQTGFATGAFSGLPFWVDNITDGLGLREKSSSINAAEIRKLASEILGHVITPDASDYDEARQVNNRAYDRHPAVIVRCVSPADVARALDFGRSHSLPIRCVVEGIAPPDSECVMAGW